MHVLCDSFVSDTRPSAAATTWQNGHSGTRPLHGIANMITRFYCSKAPLSLTGPSGAVDKRKGVQET